MAINVDRAFSELFKHEIYCDDSESLRVHNHINQTMDQIHQLAVAAEDIPELDIDHWVVVCDYGMNTHIRHIKSIEVVLCMGWLNDGLDYNHDNYKVRAGNKSGRFVNMCDQQKYLSPTIMNENLAEHLKIFKHAKNVTVDLNGGVTFREKGYLWIYNIRFGFFVKGENDEVVSYLVPNGKNHWYPIQPNQIAARLNQLDKYHGSFMIDLIRYLKYWCREQLLPKIPNSLLEAIVFNYCESKINPLSEFSDLDISGALHAIHKNVLIKCIDPIGSRGDLNSLSKEDRDAISKQAFLDYLKAKSARDFETKGKEDRAIDKWSEVFGTEFKKYSKQT